MVKECVGVWEILYLVWHKKCVRILQSRENLWHNECVGLLQFSMRRVKERPPEGIVGLKAPQVIERL